MFTTVLILTSVLAHERIKKSQIDLRVARAEAGGGRWVEKRKGLRTDGEPLCENQGDEQKLKGTEAAGPARVECRSPGQDAFLRAMRG